MSDSFLLHEEDMLKDNHFPVIGFFSVISGKKDLSILLMIYRMV